MNKIESATQWLSQQLEGAGREVIVAYSGGVDSHLLLTLVAGLTRQHPQHQYRAVHVNHGLNPNADAWQLHCQQTCQQLDMPFTALAVQIDQQDGRGIEAAAREARYFALRSLASHHSLILLGQHADDQVETFMLQLIRGAGPKGLSSMPQSMTDVNGVEFIRPLLGVSRQHIEQHASARKLRWIEDDSNQDQRFDRNFLRHTVLPTLSQRWPSLAQSVGRSAQLCAQQQALLDEVSEQKLAALLGPHMALDIDQLSALSSAWQQQLVRYWLSAQGASMPSQSVIQQLPDLLAAKADANPIIQLAQGQLRRHRQLLYYVNNYQPLPAGLICGFEEGRAELPNQLGTLVVGDTAKLDTAELAVRAAAFSQKFKPQGQAQSKPLKQWFKLWDVPVWIRQQSVQLYYQHALVAVVYSHKLVLADTLPAELHHNLRLEGPAEVL